MTAYLTLMGELILILILLRFVMACEVTIDCVFKIRRRQERVLLYCFKMKAHIIEIHYLHSAKQPISYVGIIFVKFRTNSARLF